jgi:hypothetical protein
MEMIPVDFFGPRPCVAAVTVAGSNASESAL